MGYSDSTEFKVYLGKVYNVYAISSLYRMPWYCIIDEGGEEIPYWTLGLLFEVVEPRLSRFWQFSYEPQGARGHIREIEVLIAFREWVADGSFYEGLMDGNEAEVRIFKSYKEKMDLEFPDPHVLLIADVASDDWVLCANCCEGLESNRDFGMIKCPSCSTIMRNPMYSFPAA